MTRDFVSLGMFIIDEFSFKDKDGVPLDKDLPSQIGGGGTYATIGARIWLPPETVGMIVDRGLDWPTSVQDQLERYGQSMWCFRDNPETTTTRALNAYVGDTRHFQYLTPRTRITPNDLTSTPLERPRSLHFICSPQRAHSILREVKEVEGWNPITIYEPIPDRCVPEELPALKAILADISILSPNAEEALALLSMSGDPTRKAVESAADQILGMSFETTIIIRSGALGAYILTKENRGRWVDAYWTAEDADSHVIDVTGAGNSFLGGLAAGLVLSNDVYQATLYASVSASFIVEQAGLPHFNSDGKKWNGDDPRTRLGSLVARHTGY